VLRARLRSADLRRELPTYTTYAYHAAGTRSTVLPGWQLRWINGQWWLQGYARLWVRLLCCAGAGNTDLFAEIGNGCAALCRAAERIRCVPASASTARDQGQSYFSGVANQSAPVSLALNTAGLQGNSIYGTSIYQQTQKARTDRLT